MALTIIDRLLAADAARPRRGLGDPGPPPADFSVADGTVYGVYHAALARHRGWRGSDEEVASCVKLARRAKVPEDEIDAAIAAAERESNA